jgi:hypothetical protein
MHNPPLIITKQTNIMMKFHFPNYRGRIIIASSLLIPLFSFSQDILWEKSYGGRQAEYLMDAVPTADYGFILAGSSISGKSGNKNQPNNGDLDFWIWKMDEAGDLDWQKSFGGSGTDFLQSVRLTNDGGFILAGTSNSPKSDEKKEDCRGGDDFWVIKLDAKGGQQWQKTIGGSGQEKLKSVCPTKDGGYILGGTSASDKSGDKTEKGFGNLDYWIVKLDKDGKIEWQKTYGGEYIDELRSIEQTNDIGYILGGYSNSSATGNKMDKNVGIGDYWVLKINGEGEIEWQKTIGGDMDDQLYVVHQTYDGNFILGGSSNSNTSNNKRKGNSNGTDFWIVKLDVDGNNLWQETYNIGKADILTSIVENKDHTLLLGGFAQSEIIGTAKRKDDKEINDYVAIKISENGEEIWRQSVGSDGEDILKKVVETRDGGYLLAGTSDPTKTDAKYANGLSESGAPKGLSSGLGNGVQNQQLQNVTSQINDEINDVKEEANKTFNDHAENLTKKINNAAGADKNSSLQYGVNTPNNPLSKMPSLNGGGSGNSSGGLLAGADQQPNLPASGNKAKSFGNKDFWVVKLRDKDKPTKVKSTIEAMPNPGHDFTNVIIGYEYISGTATVVDLAGHTLEAFPISTRTVPVDLSRYPDGIYIINIKTEKGSDGIKVMKN